jgi:hypothetical protein
MNKCSYFIDNKGLFGSYPSQEEVKELEELGVRYFINLTCWNEKNIFPYKTDYTVLSFPIKDHKVPTNSIKFSKFIIHICELLQSHETGLIYIHCKGGHGRAGLVVACIFCFMFKLTPEASIELTTKYHNQRPFMKEYWRKLGSPQTRMQKSFVHKFFNDVFVSKSLKIEYFINDNTKLLFNRFVLNNFEIIPSIEEIDAVYQKIIGNEELLKKIKKMSVEHLTLLQNSVIRKLIKKEIMSSDINIRKFINLGMGKIIFDGNDKMQIVKFLTELRFGILK